MRAWVFELHIVLVFCFGLFCLVVLFCNQIDDGRTIEGEGLYMLPGRLLIFYLVGKCFCFLPYAYVI